MHTLLPSNSQTLLKLCRLHRESACGQQDLVQNQVLHLDVTLPQSGMVPHLLDCHGLDTFQECKLVIVVCLMYLCNKMQVRHFGRNIMEMMLYCSPGLQ